MALDNILAVELKNCTLGHTALLTTADQCGKLPRYTHFEKKHDRSTVADSHPNCLLSIFSNVMEDVIDNAVLQHLQPCNLLTDTQFMFNHAAPDHITTQSQKWIGAEFMRRE